MSSPICRAQSAGPNLPAWRVPGARALPALPHLAEGHVPVGRELTRHAEDPFADDVARHLGAPPAERSGLAHQERHAVVQAHVARDSMRTQYLDADLGQPGA